MGYSWGEDSTADTDMTPAKGIDYSSARKAYTDGSSVHASASVPARGRAEYESRVGKTGAPVDKDITTDSTHPIGVAVDVTGSMADTPGTIFEKLPLFGKEVERYAPNYAISFTAFGDAYCDQYPLQVRDFGSGPELDEHIAALYPEGQGGDAPENHDLVAYYYVHHCQIPKAVKPLFFLITDVRSHNVLKASAIKKYTGDTVQSDLDSKGLFKELASKFTVYVLLRGYHKGSSETEYWKNIFGAQQVKDLGEPRDVVELMIGIVANEAGELEDFEIRSSKRHADKPDRVSRVLKSVKSGGILTPDAGGTAIKSSTGKSGSSKSGASGGKKMISKRLTEE